MQTMTLGPKGLSILKHFEQGPKGGHASMIYVDSTGHRTIGWGHMIKEGESFSQPMSLATANDLLEKDVKAFESSARFLLKSWGIKSYTQNEFDALVCLIFNVGPGRRDHIKGDVADSTLLEKWSKGDKQGAADQFLAWNKGRVNGKLVAISGLTRRRRTERNLFLNDDVNFYA